MPSFALVSLGYPPQDYHETGMIQPIMIYPPRPNYPFKCICEIFLYLQDSTITYHHIFRHILQLYHPLTTFILFYTLFLIIKIGPSWLPKRHKNPIFSPHLFSIFIPALNSQTRGPNSGNMLLSYLSQIWLIWYPPPPTLQWHTCLATPLEYYACCTTEYGPNIFPSSGISWGFHKPSPTPIIILSVMTPATAIEIPNPISHT